jgi:hypothetical protein
MSDDWKKVNQWILEESLKIRRELVRIELVNLDTTSNPPHWYAWPRECPMAAEKIGAGHPQPMACAGGTMVDGKRSYVTTCWHTTKDETLLKLNMVACRFDPEKDTWNKPNGKLETGTSR